MGKIAFVFSGQGDQYPGMGKELCERHPVAAEVFAMCDRLRPGTAEMCFEGTEDELKETKNTQPCLFAMELAAASVLLEGGVVPDAVAGFSLGEVVAATVSGAFGREDGFRLVCRRGELMQREAEKHDTSMAAILKLSGEKLEELCKAYPNVYPVNYNCPGQISVSGASPQMKELMADVKAAGGRAVPLRVKGAFHSPFMEEAAAEFYGELKKVGFRKGSITLYSDMTGEPYSGDGCETLARQISSPVRWENLIRNMISTGIDTFIEIGPGLTLTNMIKKTDPSVTAVGVMEHLAEGKSLKIK